MSRPPALAVVDFADIPSGVTSTDALLKASPIDWVRSGTVSRGRYLILFGGSPAAVEVALERCLQQAGRAAVDHVILANAHAELMAGLDGARQVMGGGALAILQTATAAAAVHATERALKSAPVALIEIRLADGELDGKAVVILHGELQDIDAAMEAADAALASHGGEVFRQVIAAPHEATGRRVAVTSAYSSSVVIELPGENG
jgi:microcompartment protein CcmL/EutN